MSIELTRSSSYIRRSRTLHDSQNVTNPPTLPTQVEETTNMRGPPDGGLKAWLQVLGGFLVIFNAQGLIQSYGVFQAYYEAVLLQDHSPSSIAWIGSFQIFFLFSMSVLVSPLIDKGYFRLGFNGGCGLMFVSILCTSWCRNFGELLLVQGILTGIGMGTAFGSGILVLRSYFSTRLGVAAGLTSAGGSVGGMIYPAVAEHLIFKKTFTFTCLMFAVVAFVTLLVANLLVQQHPDAIGPGKTQMDWGMFKDVPFLLMSAGLFFTFWGIYFSFYFIVAYAQSRLHLTSHESVTLLILLNATNCPGRFLPPYISDRYLGPLNTIVPSIFLTSLCLFLWIPATTHTSLVIVACFYGFFSGAVQGLYNPAIWAFPSSGARGISDSGARIAFVFFGISLAALTGTPVGGAIIKKEGGGYLGAQLFAAATVFVGGCFMVGARYAKVGWKVVKV